MGSLLGESSAMHSDWQMVLLMGLPMVTQWALLTVVLWVMLRAPHWAPH